MDYDIFNGDADGICALHQLRLADPRPDAALVTGVKRDIKLLSRLLDQATAGDRLTVLDISMDSNKEALLALLNKGCAVFYADHHFAGEIPGGALESYIDPDPEVCTSLIVDRFLEGEYRPWAVVAAFGDNLHDAARKAAGALNLSENDLRVLRELGELINYNGYGAVIEDLHLTPQDLYRAVQPFADPFDFYDSSKDLERLRTGFQTDMENAARQEPYQQNSAGRIYLFPAESWSKRVAGVFSNERARERADLAHALLVDNGNGTYMISVRAPLDNKRGADDLCRSFPTGGGRAGAAGVNALPVDMLDQFVGKFIEVFAEG